MRDFQPETWVVVFHEKVGTWWVHALALGRFKHVSAFGYVPGAKCWLIYDVQRLGTKLWALPDIDEAVTALDRMYGDCHMVKVRPGPSSVYRHRFGFYCVPAIKHLIGRGGGALRPDSLLRNLMLGDAEVIDGATGQRPGAGSGDCSAARTGEA